MPLVVAHGFMAEGVLYAQTLSRLVSMGFKVVAVDTAGHGRTPLPSRSPFRLASYVEVLEGALDHLGIRRSVLLGHSMGGRLVLEVASRRPQAAVALVLVDAIAGGPWDDTVEGWKRCPPKVSVTVGRLVVDTATTVPFVSDPGQSAKLLSLMTWTAWHSMRPGRLLAPGLALVMARGSRAALDRVGAAGVPAVVVHGGGDLAVSLDSASDAARRLGATLVVVRGGRHSWVLSDPETLPAIFGDLLHGPLGQAWGAAVANAGLDPASASLAQIEAAMCRPHALIDELTPPLQFSARGPRRKPARFSWTVENPLGA
jgi:pimeloyl-ACP methyl ester carboxylesterase